MVIKKRRVSGGYKEKKGVWWIQRKEGSLVDIKKRRESGGYKEKKGVWWL